MAKNQNTNKQINTEFGKIPPQAQEFEEAVLGAIMLEKDAVFSVLEILKPESFYSEAHNKIFKAILELSVEHKPIDIHTVAEQLKINKDIDVIGGPHYLAILTNKVASTAHLGYHSRIIAQKYIQRELIRVGAEIQTRAFEDTEDVSDMLDKAEQELFNIAEGNIKKETARIDAVLHEAVLKIEEAGKREDGLNGVPSGFSELDRMTNGWQASDLLIIAARPSMGKTAFVLSLARNTTVDHKRPVAFFSLEMTNVQLVTRLISAESEINAEKLKRGRLEDWEWQQMEHKIKKLADAPLFVDDTPALSIFEFRAKLRRLVMQHKVELAIIDYLQLMTAPSQGSREQEVSTISRSLKAIAKELNVPIIALSQLNRSVETRAGDKRPQLSDLRESGAIEQDADMVMFIHRPEYYRMTEDDKGNSLIGLAEIIIAKHRSGAVGSVNLHFESKTTRFTDRESCLIPDFNMDNNQDNVTSYSSKMNEDAQDTKPKDESSFENTGLSPNTTFDEDNSETPF